MGFFNCDDKGHIMQACPHPIDVTKAAKRKHDYYAKKHAGKPNAVNVLFHLSSQIDFLEVGDTSSASEDGRASAAAEEDDERRIFDALLSSSATSAKGAADASGTNDQPDFVMEE